MGVFTTFTREQLIRYLDVFDKGKLVDFETIEEGIENSNYFLSIKGPEGEQQFVLTIMETLAFDDLPFFNSLLAHLHRCGLPVAPPERTLDGMTTTIFCGKPTLLTRRLPGAHPERVTSQGCVAIGKSLAGIHTSKPLISNVRSNPYGLSWMKETSRQLADLNQTDRRMIDKVLTQFTDFMQGSSLDGNLPSGNLPSGIVHGDLFVDNALFEDQELTGLIDFYHACTDFFVQDIAITINAWCRQDDGSLHIEHFRKLMHGYQTERSLSEEEITAIPLMLKTGALRFFFTRLLTKTPEGYLKDPQEFRKILTYDFNNDSTTSIDQIF